MFIGNLRKRRKVQASDQVLGQWLNASVISVGSSTFNERWAGYSKVFDAWLPSSELRAPEEGGQY